MEQIRKQTETHNTRINNDGARRYTSIVFGVVEVVLAFRLIFKLLGANPDNGFVNGIYSITQPLVGIFEGIFSRVSTDGVETTAILEPATLILMIVVGLIAWLVLKLMTPKKDTHVEKTEFMERDESSIR